jgi:hypothetical protein
MFTYITIPADYATSTLAYAGSMFTDLSDLVILCVGLPIAFWVIAKVIGLARMGFKTKRV